MAKDNPEFVAGDFETAKFKDLREPYYSGLQTIKSLGYTPEDYIHYFPCFVGHQTMIRFFSLYEAYKMVEDVAGHVAELGVYKGAGSLLFAKLIHIHEPHGFTMVHGFDWFQGGGGLNEREKEIITEGACAEDKEKLQTLIDCQNLGHILKIHDMDLASDALDAFFDKYPHLYFKLVFVDAGVENVLRKTIPMFWERLTPGGMMIFDHYSFDVAPYEAPIVNELLPGVKIKTFQPGWIPTSYAIK